MIDFSVVIVTYRSASCISECLASVRSQEGPSVEVILVDNASPDDTVAVVRRSGSAHQLLANEENIGFGRGCNQGFAVSQGRYLFLLNPDACFEQRDALARVARAMEANPRWGIAGTRVIRPGGWFEKPGEVRYPEQQRVRRDFRHLPGLLAWVVGASMVVRRGVFADLGGFDPGFFLCAEETDLCLRAREKGWEIGFVHEVTVRHIGFASERGNDPYDTHFRRASGIYRFWAKHYPPEDVRRLLRRDWLRAAFRQRWYAMTARLYGRQSRSWQKLREYTGISEAARRSLLEG
jgi:N-acetylglucosaminyl-diphospho-decaprenol L-rhamnosyltransferase